MCTVEQILTAEEDSGPVWLCWCFEKAFTPSTVVFDGGLETN